MGKWLLIPDAFPRIQFQSRNQGKFFYFIIQIIQYQYTIPNRWNQREDKVFIA